MAKTIFFANLCPKKLFWELSQLNQFSTLTDRWWEHPELLLEQLTLLQKAGIKGIKLNVFNTELTQDGETIDWQPLDLFLSLAEKLNVKVHLCLGPYQYPLWPGIRLPNSVHTSLKNEKLIESNKQCKQFGTSFLEASLKRYGKHSQITGFYLGNEWHTAQSVENLDQKKMLNVSTKHMESLARLCKKMTRRPIFFNTNFDAYEHKKIEHTFKPFHKLLKQQFWLGLDVYPSQETFMKAPRLTIRRKLHRYTNEVHFLKEKFTPHIVVSEFEAQPWGDGKSWKEQIEKNPQLIDETAQQLSKAFLRYLKPIAFDSVAYWGSEFWLVAYHMGRPQMLEHVLQTT